jgi:hypothetical protein
MQRHLRSGISAERHRDRAAHELSLAARLGLALDTVSQHRGGIDFTLRKDAVASAGTLRRWTFSEDTAAVRSDLSVVAAKKDGLAPKPLGARRIHASAQQLPFTS